MQRRRHRALPVMDAVTPRATAAQSEGIPSDYWYSLCFLRHTVKCVSQGLTDTEKVLKITVEKMYGSRRATVAMDTGKEMKASSSAGAPCISRSTNTPSLLYTDVHSNLLTGSGHRVPLDSPQALHRSLSDTDTIQEDATLRRSKSFPPVQYNCLLTTA